MIKPIIMAVALLAATAQNSCENDNVESASSGIQAKRTQVQTDQNGWTIEQKNIALRLKMDNTPGAIKHLYVISPMSGQVILYSTVRGKVTSSGKRLAPRTVATNSQYTPRGMVVDINGNNKETAEVIEDDGTYGDSVAYIYWWDSRGIYHQHFFTGGQIVTVSDQPLPVHNVLINLEAGH
jgi:hypothetical protein